MFVLVMYVVPSIMSNDPKNEEDSDIDFGDDDAAFEQRRQELLRQAEAKSAPASKGSAQTDDEAFRAAFDPKSNSYHGGLKTAVPLGGQRVPVGMQDHANWRDLPEVASDAPKPDAYGPVYEKLHNEREKLGHFKKTVVRIFQILWAL